MGGALLMFTQVMVARGNRLDGGVINNAYTLKLMCSN